MQNSQFQLAALEKSCAFYLISRNIGCINLKKYQKSLIIDKICTKILEKI